MSEDPRDPAAELAEGMEAAGALIESLEQEVAEPQERPGRRVRGAEGGPGGGLLPGRRAGGEGAGPPGGREGGRGPQGGDLRPQAAALRRAAPPQQRAHQRARPRCAAS